MEEIEELRAKAIASMPFSGKPNVPSTVFVTGEGSGHDKFKSREEGEVSSSEEVELATCSDNPTNRANSGETPVYSLKNDLLNEVKKAPSAHLSTANMPRRMSIPQSHQNRHYKHIKRKQMPFRSLSNQGLYWHAKEPKNNLVISFSDDSGSEPEECSPRKASFACNSSVPVTSNSKLTDGGIKLTSKKGYTNHAIVSSVHQANDTNSGPQETSTENAFKASSSQGLVQNSAMTVPKLDILCNQISTQENQLKVPNKYVLQKVLTIDSDSKQNGLHAIKAERLKTGIRRHVHDTNLESEVTEFSKKRLKQDKPSCVSDFDVSHDLQNDIRFPDDSCPHSHHDDNAAKPCVLESKDSFSVLSAVNLQDGSLPENVVKGYERTEKFSQNLETSNLFSNQSNVVNVIEGKQQPIPTTDILSPVETFSIDERSSDLGSGNKEVNITDRGSVPFHSLACLEELHDKVLEEAQAHRRKCELEERDALVAYRTAQKALIEANERCSLLYGKREIYSAKFRAFLMEISNSIGQAKWLSQQNPHEDQLYEPDASTSVHRDNGALVGAVPPAHNPNMLMDDAGEELNRFVESEPAHVDVQIEKAHPFDTSQDYELLEASLRSELVARLGVRASSKVNDTSKKELDAERITGGVMPTSKNMEPSPLLYDRVMPSSETKQTFKLNSTERTKESNFMLANVSLCDELQRTASIDSNYSLHKVLGNQSYTATFSLPSSELHSMFKHTHMIFSECNVEAFNMKENECLMDVKEMGIAPVPDINVLGEFLNYGSSVHIDPFWPLCMFEFRGKCNDDECPWQHMKACTAPNLQLNDHSDVTTICLPNGKTDVPSSLLRALHVMPVPVYQIGQYLINADCNTSQSVLARSNWQYQQRGFCASFSIPFSVHRILPLDAPCFKFRDDHVADYSSSRLSPYYQSHDSLLLFKEHIKQGSSDIEQLLEMALDGFDGEFCESDMKKVLSLLAHAIESHPSSVLLWVVYLHIYYKKEKDIGKDDMFLHAVRHNKSSYELWLLYINSRTLCDDRLNAYDRALDVLCYIEARDGRKYFSSYILDIFLQMVDFLRMSDQVDKAIIRIFSLLPCYDFVKSSDNPLPDIGPCLTRSDRSFFWTCCIYFIVYEKLPETTIHQFEYEKSLSLKLDWPIAQVASDRKELALNAMNLAVTEMASHLEDNLKEIDQGSLQPSHFLAVNHVKCVAALESSGYRELLENYVKSYPSCMELTVMAVRPEENRASDSDFLQFEKALHSWPEKNPGIQRLWNQYVQHALTNQQIDLVEKLMARWFHNFRDFNAQSMTKDDAFGFLNLCLYWMLQKRVMDAHTAIDKSLELAAPEDYIHFVKEHALFMASINMKFFQEQSFATLLNRYLSDPRSNIQLEPLSRKFAQNIKKPRIQQMVNNILGPLSTGSTILNAVIEACLGTSLLFEKFSDVKAAVNFVESVIEMMPTNYEFALSICRSFNKNFVDNKSFKFWACNLLINSIIQATPSAPEHTWLDVASVLTRSESIDVSLRFHKQAVSVYPFSVKLWQSYANLCTATTGNASEIIEAALKRGIELNEEG